MAESTSLFSSGSNNITPDSSESSFVSSNAASQANIGLTKTDCWCLLGLFGAVLLIYIQLWFPGLVLIKRDAFHFYLPVKQHVVERLSTGELPQWFPYEGLGRPLLANVVAGVFHPFTLLYLVLPVYEAYRLSTFICILFAAGGAFVLARRLHISPLSACLAALAFSCSGYVASLTDNIAYLYSICLLPLFVFFIERTVSEMATRWGGVSALIWASVFLNGDIQTGYYYGFVAVVWAVVRAGEQWRAALAHIAGIAFLAALVAAVQLGPAWSAYSGSIRADATGFQQQSTRWSTHPLRLFTLAVSPIGESLEEDRMAREVFTGKERGRGTLGFWAESLYLSIAILGLALIGALRRTDLRVLGILAGATLVLALGKYGGVYGLFEYMIPFWSAFRYPEKFMGFVSFAIAILAGAGADALAGKQTAGVGWGAGALTCLGSGLLLRTDGSVYWIVTILQVQDDLGQQIARTASTGLFFSCAVMTSLAVLFVWASRRPAWRTWAFIGMILVITLDLVRANLPAVYTSSSIAWTFTPGLAGAIASDSKAKGLGQFRILSVTNSVNQVSPEVVRTLHPHEVAAALRRHGLVTEHNAAFHLETVQSYMPGKALLDEQIGRQANTQTLARFNVAYFIGRTSRFDDQKFAKSIVASIRDYGLTLVRNPVPTTPRVYLSKNPVHVGSAANVLLFLQGEEFLNGSVDGIEGIDQLPQRLTKGHASVLDYQPESVRVEVESSEPAVLILVDAFEPGWRARIEGGAEIPIYRANGLVRATLVPSGRHRVIFEYETPFLRLGAFLSLIGIAGAGFITWKNHNWLRRCP